MCLWRFSWCYSEVSKFEPLICGQTSVVNITYIMLKSFQPHTPHMFIYSQIELLVFARVEVKSRDASMNKLYPLLGPIWLRCFWRLWDSLEVVFRWRKWVITWSCFLLGLPASRSTGAWASSQRPWSPVLLYPPPSWNDKLCSLKPWTRINSFSFKPLFVCRLYIEVYECMRRWRIGIGYLPPFFSTLRFGAVSHTGTHSSLLVA